MNIYKVFYFLNGDSFQEPVSVDEKLDMIDGAISAMNNIKDSHPEATDISVEIP